MGRFWRGLRDFKGVSVYMRLKYGNASMRVGVRAIKL